MRDQSHIVMEPEAEPGSGQHHGESWMSFSRRMDADFDWYLWKETPKQKQPRRAREKTASKGDVSHKSTVYLWVQDTQHERFYRRTRTVKRKAQETLLSVFLQERHYWSHLNQWDLVLFEAVPREVPPLEYFSDESDREEEGRASQLAGISAEDASGLTEPVLPLSIARYLAVADAVLGK